MAKCWETATKPYARIIENTNSIISKLKVKLLENLEGHVKYFLLLSLSQQYVISFPIAKISLIVLLILTKENTQQLIVRLLIFGYPRYLQHSYFRANNKLIYNAYVISFRSRLLMIKLLSIIINGFAVVHLIFILNINLSLPSRLLCITIRELLWLMSYSTDTHEELS